MICACACWLVFEPFDHWWWDHSRIWWYLVHPASRYISLLSLYVIQVYIVFLCSRGNERLVPNFKYAGQIRIHSILKIPSPLTWTLMHVDTHVHNIMLDTCTVRAFYTKTRALRVHTPRTPCICIIVQLGHILWMTFTYTYKASVHEQKFMRNA